MGIKLEKIVFGLLLFSLILVTGVLIISNLNTNYNSGIGMDQYDGVYNTINDTYDMSQSMKNDSLINAEFTTAEDWQGSVQGSYKAVRTMKDAFAIIGNILNQVAATIGIPSFMVKFALTGFTLFIVFGVIYLFRGYSP